MQFHRKQSELRGYLHGVVSPAEESPLILTETSASVCLCRSFPRDLRELRRYKEWECGERGLGGAEMGTQGGNEKVEWH